jgi:hypothetical protein
VDSYDGSDEYLFNKRAPALIMKASIPLAMECWSGCWEYSADERKHDAHHTGFRSQSGLQKAIGSRNALNLMFATNVSFLREREQPHPPH